MTCLQRILAIDAGNTAARRYFDRLSTAVNFQAAPVISPVNRSPEPPKNKKINVRAIDFLLIPFGILLNIPPLFYLGVVIAGLMLYGFLYYETNTIAVSGPDFDHMTLSSSFQDITSTDNHWKITYEKPVISSFTGLVRHVSVDRVDMFPILSHDILVTAGDYANPNLVTTFVSDHHFSWRTSSSNALKGSINLLHIVPINKEIYTTLIQVKNGDQVTIGGREILRIDYYDQHGAFKAFWEDSGCNTIIVTSVNIQNPAP